jgi:hypothetical protein
VVMPGSLSDVYIFAAHEMNISADPYHDYSTCRVLDRFGAYTTGNIE